jgi:hypothetical protein
MLLFLAGLQQHTPLQHVRKHLMLILQGNAYERGTSDLACDLLAQGGALMVLCEDHALSNDCMHDNLDTVLKGVQVHSSNRR